MKTVTVTVYNVEELREQFPAAFRKAADAFVDTVYEDEIVVEEILHEVKDAVSYLCADVTGWNLQPYGRSYIELELLKIYDTTPSIVEEELQTLINGIDKTFGVNQELIQKWTYGQVHSENVQKYRQQIQEYIKDLQRLVTTAKLTGVDENDEKLEAQVESILDNAYYTMEMLLGEVTENAARHAQEILEYYNSEEYFIETAKNHDWYYTKQGWRLDDEND